MDWWTMLIVALIAGAAGYLEGWLVCYAQIAWRADRKERLRAEEDETVRRIVELREPPKPAPKPAPPKPSPKAQAVFAAVKKTEDDQPTLYRPKRALPQHQEKSS